MDQTIADESTLFEHAEAKGIHHNVIEILSRRSDLPGKSIVDLACGDGRTTHFLRSKGATVMPYDLFPEHCKLRDKSAYINIQERTSVPTESADLIIFQEVLEHLPNQLFALQEMHRILRPGGEVFLTTPSRSSLASKLSFLLFESETMKLPPWGSLNSIWVADATSAKRICYGHVWLVGSQQLRTMALLAGFSKVDLQRSELSRSSAFLLLIFYLPLLLISLRATIRAYRRTSDKSMRGEILEQFKINVSWSNLTSKFLIATLHK